MDAPSNASPLSSYLKSIDSQFSIDKFTRYDARLFLKKIKELIKNDRNHNHYITKLQKI